MPDRVPGEAVVHLFYLHGFASSPDSGKAAYFRDRLSPLGLPLHAPDFNVPDFSSLTVSRMLGQVEAAIADLPAGPVGLVGSSLGGFVALHAAARQPAGSPHPIARLVLLAPAVDFASGRDGWLTGGELEEWRRTGWRDVFHYAYGRTLPMHYALYEDGRRFDAFAARFDAPTLVFQGTRDQVVDPRRVHAWAGTRENVELRMLDDDHQLQAHLETIWGESSAFFGVTRE
jgi:pimeloyl-ACP methyl ester carboxylesterase